MNIGILGFGTIGSGVCEVLEADKYADFKVVRIFDRPENKEKIGARHTSVYTDITEANDIDVVVETMGGENLAYKCITSALSNGKSVVTSNKEVVSNHLPEFVSLAKANGAKFLFEASVGGGIPLIDPIMENVKVNETNRIYGIFNGTTNFILSRIEDGMTFADALKLAQKNGFAEADPTADIEGLDMVRKIAILSDLAYGTFIDTAKVQHYGIGKVTLEDVNFLKANGYSLRFAAWSERSADDVSLIVEPVFFKTGHLLSAVRDEFNMGIVEARYNGKLAFYGKGAGKKATACAVVSDIVKIMEGKGEIPFAFDRQYGMKGLEARYFVRKDGKYSFTGMLNAEEAEKLRKDADFMGRCIDEEV